MHNPLQRMEISNHNRGELSNTFGRVRNNGRRAHQGWDLAAPVGARVFAIKSGYVSSVWDKDRGAYGKFIILQISRAGSGQMMTSQDDDVFAFYAHLSEINVKSGDLVGEGQVIGAVGQTGNAGRTPPHLHFEIRTKLKPARGLNDRLDPGEILGYEHLTCREFIDCPIW